MIPLLTPSIKQGLLELYARGFGITKTYKYSIFIDLRVHEMRTALNNQVNTLQNT